MIRILPLLAVLLSSLVLAPVAPAATRDKIIKDCADDGELQGSYSASELREARQNLPSDVAEYTDCADVLRRAELPDRGDSSGGAGGGSSAGGGGGSSDDGRFYADTQEDREALGQASRSGDEPVKIDGRKVVPGAAGLTRDAARNGIPTTLLVGLILIALGGIALAAPALARRFPFLRSTPGTG